MAARLALSQTLTRLSPISNSLASATRLVSFRQRSNLPERIDPEVETAGGGGKEEMERKAMKKLEEAIHRIIVKKSEPNWLPLVPGASYWVPPKSKARGFAEVIAKLASDSSTSMTNDQALSLTSKRCWPSNANFFKGASQSPVEGETTLKHTNQSEEEEG